MKNFFNPRNVAVIGVSRDQNKVGHVIFRNLIDSDFKGKIYAVNNNAKEILGFKIYKNVSSIKEKIDLAVIATPAETIMNVVKDCNKKRIKNLVIITAGFKEVGNGKLEKKLADYLKKNKIKMVGVNCLGVFDGHSNLDTLFLPRSRLKRPKAGGISFVCQSGAVGSAILDLASEEGYGFAKFISYGNATVLDESDFIEYLGNDKNTKVICLYVEGVKNGKKFIEVCKKVSRKKPIIAIKGGLTQEGSKAALSHTGALAGKAEIYLGVFKQCKIIQAESLEEMFNFARILEKSIKPKGDRIQVITNGGGYGILCTDAIMKNNLKMALISKDTMNYLKKKFPKIVVVGNPMDLIGDATTERYKEAIFSCLNDKNVDILLVVLLLQTPLISTDIVDVIIEAKDLRKKPIVVVSTGGEFTKVLRHNLESNNVATFTFPESAVKAVKKLVEYYN
nr:CoA-binding protein [Candidatus Woesearchaeota archaeon]